MAKWLQSGTRRDACIVLYGEGELRLKELETELQDRYGEQLHTERFRRKVQKLVDAGHVEQRTEGIHDVYALTEAGRRGVERQFEWMRERVERFG